MRKFIKFIIIITIIIIIIPAAHATDSTPSADIKTKLEELKKEIASKAALLKQEVNRKLKDKAYIGKIKSKSDTSLTLATASGPKIVSINQDTVFDTNIKSKQKFTPKTISEEDFVAALGDSDEIGVLTARKIILLKEVKDKQPKAFLWGQIISISGKLTTLKDSNLKNAAVVLPGSPKVRLNDFVILTGTNSSSDIFNAGFVFVYPQGGVLKTKKMASPSASATKSAAPRPISR